MQRMACVILLSVMLLTFYGVVFAGNSSFLWEIQTK